MTPADRPWSDGTERLGCEDETENHPEPHAAGVKREFFCPFLPAGYHPPSYPGSREVANCPPQRGASDEGHSPASGARYRRNSDDRQQGNAEGDEHVTDRAEQCAARELHHEAAEQRARRSDAEAGRATATCEHPLEIDDPTRHDAAASTTFA